MEKIIKRTLEIKALLHDSGVTDDELVERLAQVIATLLFLGAKFD